MQPPPRRGGGSYTRERARARAGKGQKTKENATHNDETEDQLGDGEESGNRFPLPFIDAKALFREMINENKASGSSRADINMAERWEAMRRTQNLRMRIRFL